MNENHKKAVRVRVSVRAALVRVARLANAKDISPAQKHALSQLRQELLRADLKAETLPQEFEQAAFSPIILGK